MEKGRAILKAVRLRAQKLIIRTRQRFKKSLLVPVPPHLRETDLTILARDHGLPRHSLTEVTGPDRGLLPGEQLVMRAEPNPGQPKEYFAVIGSLPQREAWARAATENFMFMLGVRDLKTRCPPLDTPELPETREAPGQPKRSGGNPPYSY